VTLLEWVLTVYAWAGVAAIVGFIFLIGRFYQQSSGERSYYWLFLGPLLLFIAALVRYLITGWLAGDGLSNGALITGGIMLAYLCYRLYHLMTRPRA
jgi:hypothetical protein